MAEKEPEEIPKTWAELAAGYAKLRDQAKAEGNWEEEVQWQYAYDRAMGAVRREKVEQTGRLEE